MPMRRNRVVLGETFEARLQAADLLRAAAQRTGGDPEGLRTASAALDEASARFADAQIAVAYSAFAELVRIAAFLVEWRKAVLDATADGDRFLRAARLRLEAWRDEYSERPGASPLALAAQALAAVDQPNMVASGCERLAAQPLPIGVDGDEPRAWVGRDGEDEKADGAASLAELSVAFLSFAVDGTPAANLHYLTPNETHDLEIEVRISRWPDDATLIRLSSVSIEVATLYDLPTFEFAKPDGPPPYVVRQRGRAVIRGGQALRAQPFEFRYAAEFSPSVAEQPVAVVGHRTLRFESIDLSRSPLTGHAAVDQRLVEIRNTLRDAGRLSQPDLESAMSLAIGLARLAMRSAADNLFPEPMPEKQFQAQARDELRRDPQIGPQLTVHGQVAAGISDLALKGVPLELKVDHDRPILADDCQGFVEQTAAYAVGAGKRIGVLGVLNAPVREAAANPVEDGIGILQAESGLPIVTVVVPGALRRPSDLSR
jgi:hypothetical protein